MTFKQIQDRVMARTNLTSADARARVKDFINERLRAAQTSCNLGAVRRTTVTAATVPDTATVTPSNLIKAITIVIPDLNRPLGERSLDQLRTFDAANQWKGAPELWAVKSVGATSVTLQLQPIPDDVYTLQIDGIAPGVTLENDNDVPVLPEDFHDLLVFGALADELDHLERPGSGKAEAKYEQRLRELRYWLAKSAYLHRAQNTEFDVSNWWYWFYGAPWVR